MRLRVSMRIAAMTACLLQPAAASAQYEVENLGRGVIAIRASETNVYAGWRLLGTDPPDVGFNVYRATGSTPPVKLNQAALISTTNVVDTGADLTRWNVYTVRPVLQGTELSPSASFVLPANAPVRQYEFWSATSVGLVDGQGQRIADAPSSVNHAVWWDEDLLREIEDANWISKWDWNTSSLVRLLTATDAASNNGTKANAALTADLFGDWREEVIWRTADNTSLRIYSTTIPATNRIYTLMHDPQYRLAIAWQNVGYNQPPHPGFYLGEGMADPPRPRIVHRDTQPPAFKSLTPSSTSLWPPNHGMVTVSLTASLVDLLDLAPTARIVGVSSNERIDGEDDGSTSPDWEIKGPLTVDLRAERSGVGTGRVYTIDVEGSDAAGNTTRQSVTVRVPLER